MQKPYFVSARFGQVVPKTKTFRFNTPEECKAFIKGVQTAEEYSTVSSINTNIGSIKNEPNPTMDDNIKEESR